jgi:hypothetical protein
MFCTLFGGVLFCFLPRYWFIPLFCESIIQNFVNNYSPLSYNCNFANNITGELPSNFSCWQVCISHLCPFIKPFALMPQPDIGSLDNVLLEASGASLIVALLYFVLQVTHLKEKMGRTHLFLHWYYVSIGTGHWCLKESAMGSIGIF